MISKHKIGLVYGKPQAYTKDRQIKNIVKLCYHHTACCINYDTNVELEQALAIINRDHSVRLHTSKNWYWNHIAYHCVIGINGEIVHTRPLDQYGRHCANLQVNKESVGIVYVGNGNITEPTEAQYRSMWEYVKWIRSQTNVSLYPHFQYRATACPGNKFNHNKFYSYCKSFDLDDLYKN